ncbi:hypothetical protein GCM10009775_34460 [Microbacterium aoyamense]|uniref:DUF222 domain-containing protein n=1 Tax=Microbacterium aoyamense TaxID=344166 RepID=A0ABP5BBJ9_9MICO|nr:HNH endonuclease signature motif containing protein [Microbacterium aoyamense]
MGTHISTPGSWPELDALVTEMVETRAAIARCQAREWELLSAAVDLAVARRPHAPRSSADIPMREISAELGLAMRVSDRTVQTRMGDAVALETKFPSVLSAWREGRMDAGHVSAILDAGAAIEDDDARRRFEAMVIEIASETTPALLRGHAKAIAAQLDPDAAAERTRHAQDDRRVRVIDLDDGMARLLADLPATLAYAIADRLTQMARTVQDDDRQGEDVRSDDGCHGTSARAGGSNAFGLPAGAGQALDEQNADADPAHASEDRVCDQVMTRPDEIAEVRTIDQLRADILADLLLAGAPAAHGDGDALAAITAHVQVTVPALSLAGADDSPALLAGYGPVDLTTARRLCSRAPGWDRVITHPLTGAVLAVDRYRPNADIRRFLAARDERCRFPGCRRPARRCDSDHTIDAGLGGETSVCNLANFCRRHHTLKHATDWTVRQLGDGVLEWRSPTGRTYRDRPPSMVRFVSSSPPDHAQATHEHPPF